MSGRVLRLAESKETVEKDPPAIRDEVNWWQGGWLAVGALIVTMVVVGDPSCEGQSSQQPTSPTVDQPSHAPTDQPTPEEIVEMYKNRGQP